MNRIISLCPSTTYTLIDLGLLNEIVGRTIFCYKPEETVSNIVKVGGTKNPKFEKIKSLNPSHILFNCEENDIQHLDLLKNITDTVVHTPVDIESSLKMIKDFGDLFRVEKKADEWIKKISALYKSLERKDCREFSYLYLIWKEPYMLAGKGTYIDYMLSLINGKNLAETVSENRYPEISKTEIKKLKPDFLFLSTEPYPFKEKHLKDFDGLQSKTRIIDGEAMSWHGTYSYEGLVYLKNLNYEIET